MEIEQWIQNDLVKLGNWSEILVNGCRHLEVLADEVSTAHITPTEFPFQREDDFTSAVQRFAFARNVRLDPRRPHGGGMLGKRIRWHAVLPPAAPEGTLLSLRQHRFDTLSLASFDLKDDQWQEIERALRAGLPLCICGSTGSGKTSLLLALLRKWAQAQRVCVMESLEELPMLYPRWFRLKKLDKGYDGEGGMSLAGLFAQALRLRPDLMVVGEIRSGEELRVFADACSSGHGAVWTTLHAANPDDLRRRFAALGNKLETPLLGMFVNRAHRKVSLSTI